MARVAHGEGEEDEEEQEEQEEQEDQGRVWLGDAVMQC